MSQIPVCDADWYREHGAWQKVGKSMEDGGYDDVGVCKWLCASVGTWFTRLICRI